MATTTTPITRRQEATYLRPEWMADDQWRQVSADLTEAWLSLLDAAARSSANRTPR